MFRYSVEMTFGYFIIFCASTFVIWSAAELQCGPNEIEDDCPRACPYDYCPKNEFSDKKECSSPKEPCTPACKCQVNHRRADNGTCIPTRECPPFDCSLKPNEEYNACPPYCPTDECKQATPDGRCPLLGHILILRICYPKCRCIQGYWRNNSICVPYSECPKQDFYTKFPLLQI